MMILALILTVGIALLGCALTLWLSIAEAHTPHNVDPYLIEE